MKRAIANDAGADDISKKARGATSAPNDSSPSRSVYLGGIDSDASLEEVLSVVHGGLVENIRLLSAKARFFWFEFSASMSWLIRSS